jgi:hypothetical protein
MLAGTVEVDRRSNGKVGTAEVNRRSNGKVNEFNVLV